MSEEPFPQAARGVARSCELSTEGRKCAVVSWAMPLAALIVLFLGLRYPVVGIFNVVIVAFGVTALLRSLAHIHRFGGGALGRHVALGLVLNLAVLVLVGLYVFTPLDPLDLRPR